MHKCPLHLIHQQYNIYTSDSMGEMEGNKIAENWRELNGINHWKKLLEDPLDIDLRRNIIHYGNMAQATYDAFNSEKASRKVGDCKHSNREELFENVGLVKGNPFKYEVTKYLYASELSDECLTGPWILGTNSSWIGYVAVTTDAGKAASGRRDIVIAWRGTVQTMKLMTNLNWALESAAVIMPSKPSNLLFGDDKPMVHRGFLSIYTDKDEKSEFNKTSSARDQALSEVKRLVEKYKDEGEISITITGHNLGAALATLNAADIVSHGYNKPKDFTKKPCLVTAIVFGSPRVGNSKFKEEVFTNSDELRLLRVNNDYDGITSVPLPIFGDYTHVGEELFVYSYKSDYLKTPCNPLDMPIILNNLEVYLHAVAGTQGKNVAFKQLEVKRCIALVNKSLDALKDHYHVPVSWWVDKNMGMVQSANGTWHYHDRDEDDGVDN